MAPPAKRQKISKNAVKASPSTSRNIDFFFGKKSQPSGNVVEEPKPDEANDSNDLTDEQLARKLQAEWAQEDSAQASGSVENRSRAHTPLKEDEESGSGEKQNGGDDGTIDLKTDIKSTSVLKTNGKNTLSLQSTGSAEDKISSNIPFDESPLTFDPSKYASDLQGHWAKEEGNASYALLTRCFVLVNSTQSRIKIVDTLVNLIRLVIEADPESLLPTVRYSLSS